MRVDVVFLPRDASAEMFAGRAVAVFDVLRATTTMTVALAAGVKEIRVFDDLDALRRAAKEAPSNTGPADRPIMVGESHCLMPADFDLGNSPVAMEEAGVGDRLKGRTIYMSTTNGTRAIVAARAAKLMVTAALVNAAAAAKALAASGLDITLLCAGTDGAVSLEDVIGAGAVMEEIGRLAAMEMGSDSARMARRVFESARGDLRGALADAVGGRNIIRAGLEGDIGFASRLHVYEEVGVVREGPLRVVRG